MCFTDDQWMNLPDTTSVHRHPADPTARGARLVQKYSTDLIRRQRCEHFFPGGFDILPVLGSVSEGIEKEQRCLIDQCSHLGFQIDD
jgi:hypothetical protein